MTVLDLGTGTGLLAIAAIRLGSPQGLAVEINHLAAKTALRNVHLNRLFDQLLIIQGRAEDFLFNGVELLMANIHFDIMQRLIQSEGFLSKNWFILSGLMRSEAREVERMIAPKPLTVIKRWTHDDIWHTFLIRKIPS
jgi:ribosomal protein L11 methyltransferase